jgi:hypothetical protein
MRLVKERRLKILTVDPRHIVDLLNQAANPTRLMKIPTGDQIPEGTVVVSVNANWSRGGIELMLAHDQFEPVELGLEVPRVGLLEEWKQVDLVEIAKALS